MVNSNNITQCLLLLVALTFPMFAYYRHATLVVSFVVLFFIAVYFIIKKITDVKLDDKLLAFAFFSVVILSIPNVVLDNIYGLEEGKFYASALDVPSRYLIAGIIVLGLSKVRIKVEWIFYGVVIGAVYAFINYPIYAYFIMNKFRYAFHGKEEWFHASIFTLHITYFSAIFLLLGLIGYLFFLSKNKKLFAGLLLLSSHFSAVTLSYSGSKAGMFIYVNMLILVMFAWKKHSKSELALLLSPTVTAVSCYINSPWLLLANLLFAIPFLIRFINEKLAINKFIVIGAGAICLLVGVVAIEDKVKSTFTLDKHGVIARTMWEFSTLEKKHSTGMRVEMWKSAWFSFKENPIFGQGYELREQKVAQWAKEGKLDRRTMKLHQRKGKNSLHNELFNAIAKKGLVGLLLITTLYLVPLYLFKRGANLDDSSFYASLSGAMVVFGYINIGFSEAPLMNTKSSVFYVVAIILCFLAMSREATKQG